MMVKLIAVPQICRHIQSPPVHIIRRRNPFLSYLQDRFAKCLRFLVIQLGQSIVSPPSLIGRVIWPQVLVFKAEERTVRAVCRNISTFFITLLVIINSFSVHPFIKRSAVVKYTVQNHFHPSPVDLLHKFPEKFVTGLQIAFISHTADILCRMSVVPVSGA